MESWWRSGKVATFLFVVVLALLAGRYFGDIGFFDSLRIFGDKNTRAMQTWLKGQGSVEKASVRHNGGYEDGIEANVAMRNDASPHDVCALLEGGAAEARDRLESPFEYGRSFTIKITWNYHGIPIEFDNEFSGVFGDLLGKELVKRHCALLTAVAEETGHGANDVRVSSFVMVKRDNVDKIPHNLSSNSALQGIDAHDVSYYDQYDINGWSVKVETTLVKGKSGDFSDLVERVTRTSRPKRGDVSLLSIHAEEEVGGKKPYVKVNFMSDADHDKPTVASAAPALAEIMGDTRFSSVQLCGTPGKDASDGCVEYQMVDGVVNKESGAPGPLAQEIYDAAVAAKQAVETEG